MFEKITDQKCPDCGMSMEPRNTVASGTHLSRWWRCSNSRCRAEWLLPAAGTSAQVYSSAWIG